MANEHDSRSALTEKVAVRKRQFGGGGGGRENLKEREGGGHGGRWVEGERRENSLKRVGVGGVGGEGEGEFSSLQWNKTRLTVRGGVVLEEEVCLTRCSVRLTCRWRSGVWHWRGVRCPRASFPPLRLLQTRPASSPGAPNLHSTPHAHPSATKVSVKGKARN